VKKLTFALALTAIASEAVSGDAGLRIVEMNLPKHGENSRVAIWYPGGGTGSLALYADSPVFRGVEAMFDADTANGQHPVVLFSHGMGGSDRAQAWLAADLAGRGAIVLMVNHPNSTWGDFDMAKGVSHWTRAADLSAALDMLIGDPMFEGHIDASRVMAAGFSFGGWTALSLGGMIGNLEGSVEACTTYRESMEACAMLLSEDVSMQSQDQEKWNASYADARITHVAAVDPGFVWGLDASNTAALVPGTLLIGLGNAETRLSATNFDESGLAALLPEAHILRLDPAFHFSAMPLCKPDGAAILRAEDDDPVCTDPPGADRAAVHAAIVDAMAKNLGL
jgi:predicted dienelactone hydrolase